MPTSEGLNALSIGDIANVIMAAATVISLVYIASQTSTTRKQATGQFLFELDSHFRHFSGLHNSLMDKEDIPFDEPTVWTNIWSYIGLFERCKVLIDYGTMDIKIFEAFYGYRLYSLVAHPDIRASIEHSPERHQYFIRLCHDVLAFKMRHGFIDDYYDREFAEHIKNFKLLPEPVVDWRVA